MGGVAAVGKWSNRCADNMDHRSKSNIYIKNLCNISFEHEWLLHLNKVYSVKQSKLLYLYHILQNRYSIWKNSYSERLILFVFLPNITTCFASEISFLAYCWIFSKSISDVLCTMICNFIIVHIIQALNTNFSCEEKLNGLQFHGKME